MAMTYKFEFEGTDAEIDIQDVKVSLEYEGGRVATLSLVNEYGSRIAVKVTGDHLNGLMSVGDMIRDAMPDKYPAPYAY